MYKLYSRQGYNGGATMRNGECSFKTKQCDGAYAFNTKGYKHYGTRCGSLQCLRR